MTREDFIHHVIIAKISNPNIPCKIEKIIKTAIGFANYIEETSVGFDGTTHVLREEVKKQVNQEYNITIDRLLKNESPF